MDVKKFKQYGVIGAALIASSPQAFDEVNHTDNQDREFGKPRSIQDSPQKNIDSKLKLKLSQTNLPKEVWDDLGKLENMWKEVNDASSYMSKFNNSEISIDIKKRINTTYEHQLMAALSDPELKYMAKNGDYYSLLSALTNRGITNGNASSQMSTKIRDILIKNNDVRERTASMFAKASTPNDYEFLSKAVKNETDVVAGVAVVIAGVALVAGAVYVVAATGAYVATSAAFTVGGGPGGGGGGCMNGCHMPEDNYSAIKSFADEVGNATLASKAFIEMKKEEAKAAVDASLALGLISIQDGEYKNVITAMNRIIEDNAGFGQ
ncbi:hypothetical protein GTG28_15105 [Vibrio sp. OCN044]|uniref:Uncharacterized protein n=1 Tax=Vibrio tetraodonis subsp. pristinus TaxID=2695891 RepID=A0A6L8M3P5_9VIBR|nr:hypothetical protein [Vibrio tetraodonis]MYM60559.1 hypothetical protein [Vibrio tetraodonis subsp. pristinus]